jgi:ABC-type antimicrobial peptide transport system permease subunit
MAVTIQNQVRLPFAVAVGVVMQGIRIRFGRSLVTIMGVVLGIAFLMSILTSQVIKDGVRAESELRAEVKRMLSFLQAEIGSVSGRPFYRVRGPALEAREQRFLAALEREGAQWRDDPTGVVAVIVAGAAATPPGVGAMPVFVTRRSDVPGVISLDRELREDEIARQAAAERQARARTIWIVVISLLVTVIGISNAMLMSVTERFREIGTMKCLGALSAFIRLIFFIESSLVGLVGSVLGAVGGVLVAVLIYALTYGVGLTVSALEPARLLVYWLGSVAAGVVLAIVAAIYPASFASRMVPAHALRSNI